MSLHSAVALMFAQVLLHPNFNVIGCSSYLNLSYRPGQRLLGSFQGMQVFASQSDSMKTATVEEIVEVLLAPDWLDQSKSIIYFARKRNGIGLRIEAWRDGKWYHVFIPITAEAHMNQAVLNILNILQPARRGAA